MDRTKADKNADKLFSLMKEKRTNNLSLERKYLPELIDISFLIFDTPDGLPLLDPSFKDYLKWVGIHVEYEHYLTHFQIIESHNYTNYSPYPQPDLICGYFSNSGLQRVFRRSGLLRSQPFRFCRTGKFPGFREIQCPAGFGYLKYCKKPVFD